MPERLEREYISLAPPNTDGHIASCIPRLQGMAAGFLQVKQVDWAASPKLPFLEMRYVS